jgi:hypothetical protein
MGRSERRNWPPLRLPLPDGQDMGYQLRLWIALIAVVLGAIALIEAMIYFLR